MTLELEKLYGSQAYQVMIDNKALGQTLTGYLTNPIQLTTSTEWADIVESRDSGVVGKVTQAATSRSTTVKQFTEQVWRGSEIPKFSLSISRVAIRDTSGEVLDPSKKLLKWNMPPESSNPLKPPVPSLKRNKLITLVVGSWLRIDKLLPVSTDINYSKEQDKNNKAPIRYDATIQLQCSRVITASDVEGWFLK